MKCATKAMFTVLTTFLSIPFSAAAVQILMVEFSQEFWYFEYHETNYSSFAFIIDFVGNINRKKFIPSPIKSLSGPLYHDYNALTEIYL